MICSECGCELLPYDQYWIGAECYCAVHQPDADIDEEGDGDE